MAQERKKRRIVLASVLKPVDDTRMFEKMGVTLAQSGNYEVSIIGFPAASKPASAGIEFISIGPFPRLSFQRLFAKWRVLWQAYRLKPSVLIFNTHELILPAILLKIVMDVRIIYDVRENYFRNILHSGSFPWWLRGPLALAVRFKEKLLAPAVDHFILAEKNYESEFRFHRSGWTVIENKSLLSFESTTRKNEPGKIRLLFSGTLAESTGVFQAIQLAAGLHQADPSVQLHIIGYTALSGTLERIKKEVIKNPWITLTGGDQLVPHAAIARAIQQADAGILAYPDALHTHGSHPTKLFEYLSAGLPIILENHWSWISTYAPYKAFLTTSFQNPDYQSILHDLKQGAFYPAIPPDVTWQTEASRFLQAINN